MAEENQEHKALWSGRFEKSPGEFAQRFGASLSFDRRIWREDIEGSIAHAHMLAKQGIIGADDAARIEAGLKDIAGEIERGEFVFDPDDEDIHMAVEGRLIARIGEPGKKLHTGRSRNDQVATDMHLFAKRASEALMHRVNEMRSALIWVAEANPKAVMPGYTHMQKAQPVLFAHHMLAYSWMFDRDFKRLSSARDAADELVLGSAALAGTTYPLDRDAVAAELGFSHVSENSLDAVSNRDYLLDLEYACAVGMMHLSRMAEELVLWSSDEFGFLTMDDTWSTGSSIMPQKKNPDFAELVRGKSGRSFGDLMALLATMKGLPLAYDKDMQEDREGIFDAVDTFADCLHAMACMVKTMHIHEDRMRRGAEGGFMAATDLADYLAGKGMAFREAHAVVGELVLSCEKQGRTLQSLAASELAEACPLFGGDAPAAVDIDACVARRTTAGGTSPSSVAVQLAAAKDSLAADEALLAGGMESERAAGEGAEREGKATRSKQPVRAINEDDDGYDPYSDYRAPGTPFEEDPWS